MQMDRRFITVGLLSGVALLGNMSAYAIEVTTATSITRSASSTSTAYSTSNAKNTNNKATENKTTAQQNNTAFNPQSYMNEVDALIWSADTTVSPAMTVKIQTLLDWNHVSAGTIDGGWGNASKQALINFQRMQGLPTTGKMNADTWTALTENIPAKQSVFTSYTITTSDIRTPLAKLPTSNADKALADGLYFETVEEMLAERFHMSLAYIRKLNPQATYKVGETINVINTGKDLSSPISHIRIIRKDNTLYAYNKTGIIAAYPVMVGSSSLSVPTGSYTITNRTANPWYKATTTDKAGKSQVHMLPPGANNPYGVLRLGFDKADYGIHGAPSPEAVLLPSAVGEIRMTNWDVQELADNIKLGTTVEIR
ncbi:MAG: L,D-transpeptidase family protein [Moraxella sp.]|nr:L,D-transpeptidase family protein [Moraxella sp.]